MDYRDWLPKHLPTETELSRQRKETFDCAPKISIVVPLYKTKEEYLKQLVDSVKAQTYKELTNLLTDGNRKLRPGDPLLMLRSWRDRTTESRSFIMKNRYALLRIQMRQWRLQQEISLLFADHDDVLCEHALYECVKALNENPNTDVMYSDEDKMSMKGNRFFMPHFKPDFNLDLLCTVNYICEFFCGKKRAD